MNIVARTFVYLANRLLPDPRRSGQNAAQASAVLRERRLERQDVDAYLRAVRGGDV